MGSKHSRFSDKKGGWKESFGCKHNTDDTKLVKISWKVVPMTGEETKMVLRRMTTITERLTVEGTTGIKKSKSMTTHECIEVSSKR